ncbi:MAG: Ig domain-containing protein, partial [Clostridia bacterium]|nr:Ig domain-containing protein [Clostridia bacterium]
MRNLKCYRKLKTLAKSVISLLLAFMMIVGVMPFTWLDALASGIQLLGANAYEEYFFAGSGTSSDPFILANQSDFIGLANNVAHDEFYASAHYQVYNAQSESAYINLGTVITIGTDSSPFCGSLDLGNYRLLTYGPLFGTISDGAVISNGRVTLSDITGTSVVANQQYWGGLVNKVVAASGKDTEININSVSVSIDAELGKKVTGGVGGLIGGVVNTTDYKLNLDISTVTVGSVDGSSFIFTANTPYMAGFIGAVNNGELNKYTSAHDVYIEFKEVTMSGSLENSMTDACIAAIVGQANIRTEIYFSIDPSLPNASAMAVKGTNGVRGYIVGKANQAYIHTVTQSIKYNGVATLSDAVYEEEDDIFMAYGADVYFGLVPRAVDGEGTEASPYIIDDEMQFLTLAAAVNTGNDALLSKFRHDGSPLSGNAGREFLQSACYKLRYSVDLRNYGFGGIGTYIDSQSYFAFCGTFVGDNSIGSHPVITVNIIKDTDATGVFTVVDDGAVIKNFTVSGNISGKNDVGGAVGMIGASGHTGKLDVTVSDIAVDATVIANSQSGGVIGHAYYAGTTEKSNLDLSNNTFAGTVKATGSNIGGLIGYVEGTAQNKKYDDASAATLDITIAGYAFTGSLTSLSSAASNFGGCIGSIVSSTPFKGYNNSALAPSTGFSIQYNTVHLDVDNCNLNGTIGAAISTGAGFAANTSGVEADFNGVVLGSSFKLDAHNTFAGLIYSAVGKYRVDGFTVESGAKILANYTATSYSGFVFGTTTSAWIDVKNVDTSALSTGFNHQSGYSYADSHLADISGVTHSTTSTMYKSSEVDFGGMVNILDNVVTSTYEGSLFSRYYYNYTAQTIYGAGTEASPFLISTPAQLQTLSVFQYLSASVSWMMLDYFPNAAYGANYTDIDKVMFIKNAVFKFTDDIDLTGVSYYPMPIIGGKYYGEKENGTIPTITFAAGTGSATSDSVLRDNHGGLFTTVRPMNKTKELEIYGFRFTGTVGGYYYPAALISGRYVNESTRAGIAGISGGKLNIHDITIDNLDIFGGTYTVTNATNGKALLVGAVDGGDHDITDITISGVNSADALIGRASGNALLLEMQRIPYTVAIAQQFNRATLISWFDAGTAYYYYDSFTDDPTDRYDIPDAVKLPEGVGSASHVTINPTKNQLDRGLGTAASPFIIESPAQLYALASAIATGGGTLGTILRSVNGQTIPDANDSQKDAKNKAIVSYLCSAYYLLVNDIDFSQFSSADLGTLEGYKGIGSSSYPFSGHFDGQGYKVVMSDGSNDEKTVAVNNFGLFGHINGATIQNVYITAPARGVNITAAAVTTSTSYNGFVAAVIDGGDNIFDNIMVSGLVKVDETGVEYGAYFGGYVGALSAGTLQLYNVPNDYVSTIEIRKWTSGGEYVDVGSDDQHFASVVPYLKDGRVLYMGDDASTSVRWTANTKLEGTVNESFSWDLGGAYVGFGSAEYTYSWASASGENLKSLPSDLGLTLNSQTGILSGYPKYSTEDLTASGELEFQVKVSVKNNITGDRLYTVKTFTIKINRADFPAFRYNNNDMSSLTYQSETAELSFYNFPKPQRQDVNINESEIAVSDADLKYETVNDDGEPAPSNVVSIETDANGKQIIKILNAGTVHLKVTKEKDRAYNEQFTVIDLVINKADLWVSVSGARIYKGTDTNKVPGFGTITIEGLRGTTGAVEWDPNGEIATVWNALGLSVPNFTMPPALLDLATVAEGSYPLTLDNITAPQAVTDNYRIRLRHGAVSVITYRISQSDYKFYNLEKYISGEDTAKTNVMKQNKNDWYNFDIGFEPTDPNCEIIIGASAFDQRNPKTFESEQHSTITFTLHNKELGWTSEPEEIYINIDKTAPTVQITYNNNNDPYKLINGYAAYKSEFPVSISANDPVSNGVSSDVHHYEYYFIDDFENVKNVAAAVEYAKANPNGWKQYTTQLTANKDTKGAIYLARAVDKAGNYSSIEYS